MPLDLKGFAVPFRYRGLFMSWFKAEVASGHESAFHEKSFSVRINKNTYCLSFNLVIGLLLSFRKFTIYITYEG
jgi:hypothetical protein